MKNWKPFYFEGNLYFGFIKSPEDWKTVKLAYKNTDINLLEARVNPSTIDSNLIRFGFYIEYNGELTLSEWAKENKIKLD